jgi:thiol-disulfide isomerase/thioredoxin
MESFSQYLGMLADLGASLGGSERAFEILDEITKRAQELAGSTEQILLEIDVQRALQLAKANRADEARAIIDAQLASANESLDKAANDVDAILRKAAALKNRVKLESAAAGGDAAKAWSELLDFLFAQAAEHKDDVALKNRFESEHVLRARTLARSDPDAAEALVVRIESLSNQATPEAADGTPQAAASRLLLGGRSPLAALRAEIEKTRKMLALVGSPAMYPENVDGWVNGEALTVEALRGKVVLVDFFAVWCGPCIATFPHLREWHDEYADKGLQIIGLTNYEEYGWDEVAGRAARQDDIEPEAERAAMELFVKHHELRHPIAFVAGRELHDFYGVSGIPHAVIIDRAGKVRLFRIGSGAQNAADLKQAIEECLAEAPVVEQSAGE